VVRSHDVAQDLRFAPALRYLFPAADRPRDRDDREYQSFASTNFAPTARHRRKRHRQRWMFFPSSLSRFRTVGLRALRRLDHDFVVHREHIRVAARSRVRRSSTTIIASFSRSAACLNRRRSSPSARFARRHGERLLVSRDVAHAAESVVTLPVARSSSRVFLDTA